MKEYEASIHQRRSSVMSRSILLPVTQLIQGGTLEEGGSDSDSDTSSDGSSDATSASESEPEAEEVDEAMLKELEETVSEGNELLKVYLENLLPRFERASQHGCLGS